MTIFVQLENSTAPSLGLGIFGSSEPDAGGSDRRAGVPRPTRVNRPIVGAIPEFATLQH